MNTKDGGLIFWDQILCSYKWNTKLAWFGDSQMEQIWLISKFNSNVVNERVISFACKTNVLQMKTNLIFFLKQYKKLEEKIEKSFGIFDGIKLQ
jgi:hypothetical protein